MSGAALNHRPFPPRLPKLAGGSSLPSALSQPHPTRQRAAAFRCPPRDGRHDPATYRDRERHCYLLREGMDTPKSKGSHSPHPSPTLTWTPGLHGLSGGAAGAGPLSLRGSSAARKFGSRVCRGGCAAGGSGLGRLLAARQRLASGAGKPPPSPAPSPRWGENRGRPRPAATPGQVRPDGCGGGEEGTPHILPAWRGGKRDPVAGADSASPSSPHAKLPLFP